MSQLMALLSIHFVADFVCQSDWMAQNKSKRWDALLIHVSSYSFCFMPFALWQLGNTPAAEQFLVATFVLHFITDAVTSRITSRLWFYRRVVGIFTEAEYCLPQRGITIVNPWEPIEGSKRHWFFVCIGFDQLLHAYALGWMWSAVQ